MTDVNVKKPNPLFAKILHTTVVYHKDEEPKFIGGNWDEILDQFKKLYPDHYFQSKRTKKYYRMDKEFKATVNSFPSVLITVSKEDVPKDAVFAEDVIENTGEEDSDECSGPPELFNRAIANTVDLSTLKSRLKTVEDEKKKEDSDGIRLRSGRKLKPNNKAQFQPSDIRKFLKNIKKIKKDKEHDDEKLKPPKLKRQVAHFVTEENIIDKNLPEKLKLKTNPKNRGCGRFVKFAIPLIVFASGFIVYLNYESSIDGLFA